MTREVLIQIIRDHFGTAPDSWLAETLSAQCRTLPEDTPMPAIRDVMLDGHPESAADRDARRARLSTRLGLEDV